MCLETEGKFHLKRINSYVSSARLLSPKQGILNCEPSKSLRMIYAYKGPVLSTGSKKAVQVCPLVAGQSILGLSVALGLSYPGLPLVWVSPPLRAFPGLAIFMSPRMRGIRERINFPPPSPR